MIVNSIHDFCKWWALGLHSLVPKRLHSICLWRCHRLIGVLECTAFSLFEITGTRQRQLLRVGAHVTEPSADFSAVLRRIRQHRQGVTLRLDHKLGLRKLLKLPLAARNDLDQLLRFEMDRLSPFDADNVYFAYRIVQADPKAGVILVEVQIVPRKIAERALATAGCLGLQTSRLEFADAAADGRLNLLPRQTIKPPRMSWLEWALALLAVAFAAVAMAMPLHKQHTTAADLEQQAFAQKKEAEKSLTLRQQLDSITSAANFSFEHREANIMMARVLAELTRLIPDDAYLVQIHINDGEVSMQGYAQSVSDLIGALERSPLFSEAEFRAPITMDPHSGRERFQIAVGMQKDG